MRVWVTRAEPGASRTAQALRRLGHAPLVAPVLEVRRLATPLPDLEGVGALAFTSRAGIDAFAELTPRRDLPVFAVGDATANAARERGFADVASADGDVEALAALIAARWPQGARRVLHPCAAEPARDLVGALAARGMAAVRAPLYETVAAAAPPPVAAAALEKGEIDAVLAHSPKAARALAGWLEGGAYDLHAVRLAGLSPACLAPLEHVAFAVRGAAEVPTEAALLARLTP